MERAAGGPRALARPSPVDAALIAVAVAAVSTSGPLIRAAVAPALAVACWRNLLAAAVLAPVVAARRGSRRELAALSGRERRLAVGAGALLAAHFATWVPSLSFTTVASSVALVATQPIWAALLARLRGERVPGAAWVGIGVAVLGAAVLGVADLAVSGRALLGDALALAGGVLAAAYVTVGAEVRRTVTTTTYTALCYGTAAVVLLVVCAVGRQPLLGYDGWTWVALVALTVGPQLLGHSVFNRVLRTTSPTVVSVSILFEIVGAAVLAAALLGESPPPALVPAGSLIAAGVVLVVRAGERRGG